MDFELIAYSIDFKIKTIDLDGKRIKLQIVRLLILEYFLGWFFRLYGFLCFLLSND
jgi:hypothetical protein